MVALSALVPATEQPLVQARAALLERDAQRARWRGGRRPACGLSRRVSLVVAAIAPRLPYERLSLLVRYALWTFLLDDELDRPGAELAELDRLGSAVAAVTAGGPPPAGAPLATELHAIWRRLSTYDRHGAAVRRCGAALRETVAAEARHVRLARAVASGESPPPTVEEYLPVAAHTVNYASFAYALLALQPDPPPAPDQLAPAVWHAACAVRLSNDLRGASRDTAGGELNALGLPATGGPVTRQWMRRAIDAHVQEHEQVLAHLPSAFAGAAQVLRRSARVSVGFYRLSDLR